MLVQGRRAGVRADPGPDGAVLPELRRQRDVPVDRQRRSRTRTSRCCSSTSSSPNRVRVSGRATITDDPALVGRYPAPCSPSTSPSTTCSRTARATSTAATATSCRRTCPTPTGRRRSPSGSACRCSTRCSPPTTRPVPDLSRRALPRPRRDGRRRRAARTTTTPHRRTPAPPTPTTTPSTADHVDDDVRRPRRPRRPPRRPRRRPSPLAADPFALGVTAGDPDATSVVLWTRLVGDALPDAVDVTWETSTDDFATVASVRHRDGDRRRRPQRPRRRRRRRPGRLPLPGRRRSPARSAAPRRPSSADGRLKVAAVACQHFETGFYAAHRDLAEWAPDAVVFLGDFIYEGAGAAGRRRRSCASTTGPSRPTSPGTAAATPSTSPTRDLQAARAACPWLVIWDDHEVENNYAGADAAGPERPGRRSPPAALAAYQVWWEHMPVRIPKPQAGADTIIYRTGRYGDLLDLVLLDGRQFRSDQACGDATLSTEPACAEAADPSRTMLGADAGGLDRRGVRGVDRDVGRARPADRAHRPAPAERRDPQRGPVGRLRAGPRPAAGRGRARRRQARRAHRRHPPRRRRRRCPASAPSS